MDVVLEKQLSPWNKTLPDSNNVKVGLQFKNDYSNDVLGVFSLDCFIGLKA